MSFPNSVAMSLSKTAMASVALDPLLYSPPTARVANWVSKKVFLPEMTVTLLLMDTALLVMKL